MIRKIVLVSETPEVNDYLVRSLASEGLQVVPLSTLKAAIALLRDFENSSLAVVLDTQFLSESDAELLMQLKAQHRQVPIMVFCSARPQEQISNRLAHSSSIAIFNKSINDPSAALLIARAFMTAVAEEALAHAPATEGASGFERNHPGRVGARSSRLEVEDSLYADSFLRRVGLSDVPVLLHGETGAGKEVMARKLWSYSNRVGKPFLKLNCAALPSELIESELFGYEKGAFTGALVDKPGKFELAQDGTILLDEIGDMDTRLQAKLLQVLQDGEIQPLGSSRIINVNVRIMAATHRDLQAAIAQGTFREDLYYRLSVINITIPPLRERRDEIIPLAEKLLLRHVGQGLAVPAISENLRRALLAHPWPGNVRELENVMRRFLVYEDASLLAAELTDAMNPPKIRLAVARGPGSARPAMSDGRVSFDHFAESSRTAESKLLLETLESVRWNRRQAAIQLNIDYKALLYKLQKHGIVESKAKRREVSA
jgi:two-component system response regulator AtoC